MMILDAEEEELPTPQQELPAVIRGEPSPMQGSPSPPQRKLPSLSTPTAYDFEATGIEQRNVAPREFIDACKSIATLQITRDLQTDNMSRLSSLLQGLPADIVKTVTENPASVPELASKVDPALLALDIDEQAATVRLYRDVVTRQHEARTELLQLLQASRCQFGSQQVAETYHALNDSEADAPWIEQSHVLADALELEGLDLDTVIKGKRAVKPKEDLPPLAWCDSSKRQKKET